MTALNTRIDVRHATPTVSIFDIHGEVNAASSDALTKAYASIGEGKHVLILNFSGLQYMNSTGIGLLVTLLVRANRQNQKVFAFGLSEHYRRIFKLTRLDEAIHLYASEAEAVAAASAA
jgi:anti-sigma B factor antagonist